MGPTLRWGVAPMRGRGCMGHTISFPDDSAATYSQLNGAFVSATNRVADKVLCPLGPQSFYINGKQIVTSRCRWAANSLVVLSLDCESCCVRIHSAPETSHRHLCVWIRASSNAEPLRNHPMQQRHQVVSEVPDGSDSTRWHSKEDRVPRKPPRLSPLHDPSLPQSLNS